MATTRGGKREGAGRPRVGEIQLRAKIPADEAAEIEEFGEGKGLSEGLRRFVDFSLSSSNVEIWPGVFARYRSAANVDFDEFVKPLRGEAVEHNVYGSMRDVLSVKGRLPFNGDRTLWIVVPGRRISIPSPAEYEQDAETILEALRAIEIRCRWVPPS